MLGDVFEVFGLCRPRSVPLGKYRQSSPLVFSLVRRCRAGWVTEVDGHVGGDAQERCDDAGISLRVPRPGLCTDYGAMVASLGAQRVLKGRAPSELGLPADSSRPVTLVQS